MSAAPGGRVKKTERARDQNLGGRASPQVVKVQEKRRGTTLLEAVERLDIVKTKLVSSD